MSAQVINGREVALKIRRGVKVEALEMAEKTGVKPCLAVIIVGKDPGSLVYVKNKKIACKNCAIESREYALPETITQDELLEIILKLNKDKTVHGILVQSPLPKHIDEAAINLAIDPLKDVDAFHPMNQGRLLLSSPILKPCTPSGVIELLDEYKIPIEGRECVVVGRSKLVGKPLSVMLLARNGTVTTCHSRTRDLGEVTRRADILCVAIGRPRYITADMVKEGAAVIDVGMNRLPEGLCGDVDYDAVAEKASYITPVPGGVGRMTVAMLMKNTLTAARIQTEQSR